MLFAALNESKHQLLQKMAGMTDRPASKQLEVRLYELQTKTLTTEGFYKKHSYESVAFFADFI